MSSGIEDEFDAIGLTNKILELHSPKVPKVDPSTTWQLKPTQLSCSACHTPWPCLTVSVIADHFNGGDHD